MWFYTIFSRDTDLVFKLKQKNQFKFGEVKKLSYVDNLFLKV